MRTGETILLDEADNVATVLRQVEQGESVSIAGSSGLFNVVAKETIPIFHKIAIKTLSPGSVILKHGDSIGMLMTGVDKGALVHVHNLRSNRAVTNTT